MLHFQILLLLSHSVALFLFINLEQNKIDFRLRSMQLNLTTSTTLITNLTSTQKICAVGHFEFPVVIFE